MKIKIAVVLAISLVVGLFVWFVGLPEHSYQLVSREYNFSAAFSDTPAVSHSQNDEGLPKTQWTLKHDHGTWTEYFDISATCYNETLDPAKEFDGADADPTLILNGIHVLKSGRTTIQAVETGRELPAYSRMTEETATKTLMAHNVILDGHCMIDYGARMNRNEGPASLYMGSVKILK
jgi:hypothetical protein